MRTNTQLRDASTLYSRQSYNKSTSLQDRQLSLLQATPRAPNMAPTSSQSMRARRAVISTDDVTLSGGNLTFITSEVD